MKIHLKINSGMNRFGFKDIKQFKKALNVLKKSKLEVLGIYTHFATTDNYINEQMKTFLKFVDLAKQYYKKIIVHADNSVVSEIKNHNLNMVRIGFNLYNKNTTKFNSVVKIKTEVAQINMVKRKELVGYNYRFVANKKCKVAVLPVGYADGFGVEFCGLKLTVNNKDCKILNVCMDCLMLDVSKLKIKKGDEIYLLDEFNSLEKYAKYSNVPEYQIMTNFSKLRADRIIES